MLSLWTINNDFKIKAIEGITGIPNLSGVKEYLEYEDEINSWILFFDKKYLLSRGDSNPLFFIKNVIGISEETLRILNADSEGFYYNFSTKESLRVIFEKLLNCSDDIINSKNGFPEQYNISNSDKDKLHDLGNGNFIFPASSEMLSNLNFMCDIVKMSLWKNGINQETKILYHATSWQDAIFILDEISIIEI